MPILDDLMNLFSLGQIHEDLNETEDFIDQKVTKIDSAIKTAGIKPENKKSRVDAAWVTRTAFKKIKIKMRKL